MCFKDVVATAILLKVDGAINEEHRDSRDKARNRHLSNEHIAV